MRQITPIHSWSNYQEVNWGSIVFYSRFNAYSDFIVKSFLLFFFRLDLHEP